MKFVTRKHCRLGVMAPSYSDDRPPVARMEDIFHQSQRIVPSGSCGQARLDPFERIIRTESSSSGFKVSPRDQKPASLAEESDCLELARQNANAFEKIDHRTFTTCLGRPITMSSHHGSEALGYSKAM